MAEVFSSYLNLLDPEDPHQNLTIDSFPFWTHHHHHLDHLFSSESQLPPSDQHTLYSTRESSVQIRALADDEVSDIDLIANAELFGRENQVNFVMDLFQQRVGFGSDSDEEENDVVLEIDLHSENDEFGLDHVRKAKEVFDDWGNVDDRQVDQREREVVIGSEEEVNPGLDNDAEHYFGEHEDYTADAEDDIMGNPPASKSVVENLSSVVLTKEDVENNNALCAVCKDGIGVGEQAKQLPCAHRYHGDCILRWLEIRNTCPVCRYELPTDDAEYERRRDQRAGRGV